MGFKDLFITSDEKPVEKPTYQPREASKTKFPSAESQETPTESSFKIPFGFGKTTTTPSVNAGEVSSELVAKATERYIKGFETLNQPGYDFYEFYQAVQSIGASNPQGYPMAFTMAKTMDKSITKESLLSQSEFYASEIEKSYQETITKGNAKKEELLNHKNTENQALVQELGYMREQLENMKIQIQDRENKLKAIGGKYEPQINEIDSKLAANDIAKNQLVASIEQVKQGILNNLK